MPLDYETALSVGQADIPANYDRNQAILYALGLGFGRDPMDDKELSFVYEENLVVVPTIAATLASVGDSTVAGLGINLHKLVHGAQAMTFHRPMPPSAETLVSNRIVDVFDKGSEKGAIVVAETSVVAADGSGALATITSSLFARGDGGFMKDGQTSRTKPPQVHQVPDRQPDLVDEFKTRPDQALLYRLSGDFNPLHADPKFAAKAGFERPILHGLCTYGICARSILKTALDYDAARMKSIDARFSGPVIPGETIVTEIWVDGSDISFRASVKERAAPAVSNGLCLIS